jgi:peptide-methionine (S)-S-oxide reductase
MIELETATLGGGCFWCLDAVFRDLIGVEKVESGYAGGTVPDPTYEQVCGKRTGHAEVVQVTFDPRVLAFEELLRIFFEIHDPTTPDGQGADVGPQYRSIILHHSEAQAETAREVIRDIEEAGIRPDPIVTEVAPLAAFYPAETVHQDYYRRNTRQPYCRIVIDPKLAKFRRAHADRIRGDSRADR